MADQIPEGAIPEEEFNSIQGPPPGAIPEEDFQAQNNEKYGSALEMAKTALEQGLSGATLGLSKVAETKLFDVDPNAISGREEANPITAGLSNIGGTAGLLIGTGGLSGIAEGAGALGRVGTSALEGAGIGGVSQATDDWSQNKPLDAQKIAASAGLGALIGGSTSGLIEGLKYKLGTPLAKSAQPAIQEAEQPLAGEIKPVISEADAAPYEEGNFETTIKNSPAIPTDEVQNILEGTKDVKENAQEIASAAQTIRAPVLEGMISDNKWVQRAEDSLLNGAPTFSGQLRTKAYDQVYQAVKNATDTAIGENASFSKAELGNLLKEGIIQKINQQVAPINELYGELKNYTSAIPLSERSAPAIARNISNLQEIRISPSSPEGQLAKRVINEIGNLKTVDDVKVYKSVLMRSVSPTASSGEKRMAAILADKLGDLEDSSILRFAKTQMKTPEAQQRIASLIDQKQLADQTYKPFKQDLQTLGEQLGKGKVYGAQDAIDFIQNRLTPEELTQKLFSKNNSEFLNFFQKKFPDEMGLMRQYQKSALRDQASKTGTLTPAMVFKEVNKLQPEVQKALFSQAELQQLKAAEIVRNSIPKNFNPSGTERAAQLGEFFKHPKGALLANARDAALLTYIKMGGGNIANATSAALQKHAETTNSDLENAVKSAFTASSSQARKAQ